MTRNLFLNKVQPKLNEWIRKGFAEGPSFPRRCSTVSLLRILNGSIRCEVSCLYLSSRFLLSSGRQTLISILYGGLNSLRKGSRSWGARGGADQLTLSQSGVTYYAQCITNLLPPPIFRPSYGPVAYKYSTYVRYVSRISIRIIIGVLKISDSAFPVWSYW